MIDNRFLPVGAIPRRESLPFEVAASPTTDDSVPTAAIGMLNRALALLRGTALRCKREYHNALHLHSPALAVAALEHANDTGGHAHGVRERIRELGGKVEQPADMPLPQQRAELQSRNPMAAVIADDLSCAQAALDGYREIAAFFRPFDSSTCRLLASIIEGENGRAEDLATLLAEASAHSKH